MLDMYADFTVVHSQVDRLVEDFELDALTYYRRGVGDDGPGHVAIAQEQLTLRALQLDQVRLEDVFHLD